MQERLQRQRVLVSPSTVEAGRRSPFPETGSCARPAHPLLQLQRQYGNRYVQRVLALARQGEGDGEVTPAVESDIERSRGGGQALDHGVRRQMEPAFGANFGGVRVHTGHEAHELNRAVNAVAFTTGQDIFFRDGADGPESSQGKELLAHELTHVVQQGGTASVPSRGQRFQIQRMCGACQEENRARIHGKLMVGRPGDEYEKEADRVAKELANGEAYANRGDVFVALDDTDDYGDMGDGFHRDQGRKSGAELLQRQDGGTDAGAPAACAQPVNFALGAAHDSGPDAIQIPISWDSSTGNLTDLSNCTIREVVNYDAIPNPPFLWNPPNPTILTVPGVNGAAQDTHSYPPGLKTGITNPRASGTMVAHQVYQFQCTGPGCSGTWQTLPGQTYTITREVFPEFVRLNPWRYRITKSGVANGSREVEVPEP